MIQSLIIYLRHNFTHQRCDFSVVRITDKKRGKFAVIRNPNIVRRQIEILRTREEEFCIDNWTPLVFEVKTDKKILSYNVEFLDSSKSWKKICWIASRLEESRGLDRILPVVSHSRPPDPNAYRETKVYDSAIKEVLDQYYGDSMMIITPGSFVDRALKSAYNAKKVKTKDR